MAIQPQTTVAIDLLDSAQGHPVQTWKFESEALIRIGRADESDVKIADPRVSRLHAELEFRPEGWKLISRGRHGVYVDGVLIEELTLADKRTFQLASGGPLLRFRTNTPSQANNNMTTIDGSDPSIFEALQIDLRKREEEVQQITNSELFHTLRKRADLMRRKNQADQE
jgi:pSer/pThr/pTyr-binding forkhead associated (FHA) protein